MPEEPEEDVGSEPDEERDEEQAPGQSPWPGLLILLGLLLAAGYGISQLAPDEVREKADPGFLDNIFANDVVIAAARLVALFAAMVALAGGVYIVGSMVVRMGRGEWLRKAGFFESQVIEAKIEEASNFFEDWLEALQTNEDLEERLEQRDAAIHDLLTEREALIEALHERGTLDSGRV